MKKELLLLSFLAGALVAYSADQEQVLPIQEKAIAATEEIDPAENTEEGSVPFVKVEKKAEFPGGHKKLMEYLRGNIKYPEQALAKSIEGKVYVKFTVKKDGSIDDVKIIRSTDSLLDEEAIRVVKNMPKWIPGQTRNDIESDYSFGRP